MSYAPPPVTPGTPAPPPQWGSVPPSGAMGYRVPQTEGLAIAALILAIVSFVVCPLIASVVALALAHAAGNKIDASGGRLSGAGMVRAAQIVAWVNIGLVTVGTILLAAVFANADSWTTNSLGALLG